MTANAKQNVELPRELRHSCFVLSIYILAPSTAFNKPELLAATAPSLWQPCNSMTGTFSYVACTVCTTQAQW